MKKQHDELIKSELLSLVDTVKDYVKKLDMPGMGTVSYDGVQNRKLTFNLTLGIEWEVEDFNPCGDVCDYDYTGNVEYWRLIDAIAIDEDGKQIKVSKEIIKLFNEKI